MVGWLTGLTDQVFKIQTALCPTQYGPLILVCFVSGPFRLRRIAFWVSRLGFSNVNDTRWTLADIDWRNPRFWRTLLGFIIRGSVSQNLGVTETYDFHENSGWIATSHVGWLLRVMKVNGCGSKPYTPSYPIAKYTPSWSLLSSSTSDADSFGPGNRPSLSKKVQALGCF